MTLWAGSHYGKKGSAATKSEKHLRTWWADRWPHWMEWREPGKGCGVGAPDMQILLGGSGVIVPVELKLGSIGRAAAFNVRPAQFVWHRRFAESGGTSCFLVGSQASGDKALVKFKDCRRFERSFELQADTWLEVGGLDGPELGERVIEFLNQSRDD